MTTEPSISERIIPILDAFSAKFHKNFSGQHRLASPLGAWCLLAFIAAKDKNPSPEVIANLGCSTKEAKKLLHALLKEKPAEVALAVNAWFNPSAAGSSVSSWSEDVKKISHPAIRIPTVKELNEWANEESEGLVKEFPVKVDSELFLALFANVVGTEITWDMPLKLRTHEEMSQAWKIDNCLVDDKKSHSDIYCDSVHGQFAVHCGSAKGTDLTVYSVLALDKSVSEADTMAVARKIASGSLLPVPLADLELGKSANGSLLVTEVPSDWPGEKDDIKTYLPAWNSSNEFDLLHTDLGFKEAMNRFSDLADNANDIVVKVAQVASAEYSAMGFKATAASYAWSALRSGGGMGGENKSYKVEIQFNRPYAVVAGFSRYGDTLKGLPVFDGWISEASESEIRRRGGSPVPVKR